MDLNLQAKMDVEAMLKAAGRALSLADLPDIIELNTAAHNVSNPDADSSVALSLLPVTIGNLTLYPPKLAGLVWFDEHLDWWSESQVIADLALADVCAGENQVERIKPLNQIDETLAQLRAWGKTVNASIIEISHALAKFLPPTKGGGDPDGNHWPVVSLLCREYGCTPKYWIEEAPIGEIICLLTEYQDRQKCELKALQKATKGRVTEQLTADKAKAIKAYREKLNAIKAKWGITNG